MGILSDALIVSIISGGLAFAGTALSNSRTKTILLFRIEQLEKKVEKHNGFMERLAILEQSTKTAHHRIDELK